MNIDASPPSGLITTRMSGMNTASPSERRNHTTASSRLFVKLLDSSMNGLCRLMSVTSPINMLSNADLNIECYDQLQNLDSICQTLRE